MRLKINSVRSQKLFCSFCIHSCDLNLKDQCGCTPLHISVMENRPNILKILLSRGASVALKDKKNRTPLHYSIELVHISKPVKLLCISC